METTTKNQLIIEFKEVLAKAYPQKNLDSLETEFNSFVINQSSKKSKNERLIQDEFNILAFIFSNDSFLEKGITSLRSKVFKNWFSSKYAFAHTNIDELNEASNWLFNAFKESYAKKNESYLNQLKNFLVLVNCFYKKIPTPVDLNFTLKDFYPNIIFSNDISPVFYNTLENQNSLDTPNIEMFFSYDSKLNNIYIYEEFLKIYSEVYGNSFGNFKPQIILYAVTKAFIIKNSLPEINTLSIFESLSLKNNITSIYFKELFNLNEELVYVDSTNLFEKLDLKSKISTYTQVLLDNKLENNEDVKVNKLKAIEGLIHELNNERLMSLIKNNNHSITLAESDNIDTPEDTFNNFMMEFLSKIRKPFKRKNLDIISDYTKKTPFVVIEKLLEKKYYLSITDFYNECKKLKLSDEKSLQLLFLIKKRKKSSPFLFRQLTNAYLTREVKGIMSKTYKEQSRKTDNPDDLINVESKKIIESEYNQEELNNFLSKIYANNFDEYNEISSIRKILKFFLIDVLKMRKKEFGNSLCLNSDSIITSIIHKAELENIYLFDFKEKYFWMSIYFGLKEENSDFSHDFSILEDISKNLDDRNKKQIIKGLGEKNFKLKFNKDFEYVFDVLLAFKTKIYLGELKNIYNLNETELNIFQNTIIKEVFDYKRKQKKGTVRNFIDTKLKITLENLLKKMNKEISDDFLTTEYLITNIYEKSISLGENVKREISFFNSFNQSIEETIKRDFKIYFTPLFSKKNLILDYYSYIEKYNLLYSLMLNLLFYDDSFDFNQTKYNFGCIASKNEIKNFIYNKNQLTNLAKSSFDFKKLENDNKVWEIVVKNISLT